MKLEVQVDALQSEKLDLPRILHQRSLLQDLPPWNASEESSGIKFQFPHLELVGIGLLEALGEQGKETRALLGRQELLGGSERVGSFSLVKAGRKDTLYP